jgi:hypothetical protein
VLDSNGVCINFFKECRGTLSGLNGGRDFGVVDCSEDSGGWEDDHYL